MQTGGSSNSRLWKKRIALANQLAPEHCEVDLPQRAPGFRQDRHCRRGFPRPLFAQRSWAIMSPDRATRCPRAGRGPRSPGSPSINFSAAPAWWSTRGRPCAAPCRPCANLPPSRAWAPTGGRRRSDSSGDRVAHFFVFEPGRRPADGLVQLPGGLVAERRRPADPAAPAVCRRDLSVISAAPSSTTL